MKSALITVLGALAVTLCAAGAEAGNAPPAPAALSPCALAATEIGAIFGMTVDKAELADIQFPGGRDVGCIYTFQGTQTVLSIRQTWGTPSSSASAAEKAASGQAPRPWQELQAIAGDPDHAAWKVSERKDDQSVTLTYVRAGGKAQTTVSVHGGAFDVATMQQKLLLLRRVP